MGKVKTPPSKLAAEWEAPRVVLERIVMRRGSLRGIGQGCGRSTMFLWRQLRQNKGFNLFATGRVLTHIGVPARFFYEEVLDLSPQYDPAWVLQHFRENGDIPRDPFLAAVGFRLNQLLQKATVPGRRRRRRGEIEALEERGHFDGRTTKTDLEKLGMELLLLAESAASGDRGLERGQLVDSGHLLLVWGAIQQSRGHRDDSVEAHVLGYRLALAGGDSRVLGKFFCSASSLLSDLGQPGPALRFVEHARRLFQRDRGLLARALVRASLALSDLRRYEDSRAEALTALRFAARDDRRTRAAAWLQLGNLALLRGEPRKALASIGWAKKNAPGGGDLRASILWREGWVLGRLGRPRPASAALLGAIRAFEKRGQPLDVARVAVDLAEMLVRAGRGGEARKAALALTPGFERLGNHSPARALWLDLLALLLQGSWSLCLEHTVQLREALRRADLRIRPEV